MQGIAFIILAPIFTIAVYMIYSGIRTDDEEVAIGGIFIAIGCIATMIGIK